MSRPSRFLPTRSGSCSCPISSVSGGRPRAVVRTTLQTSIAATSEFQTQPPRPLTRTVVYCLLPLANQAPFIHWSTPEDGAVFPSGAEVFFNATDSWDLDNDALTFKWRSSLDDDIVAGCSGVFSSNDDPTDGAPFLANGDSSTTTPPYCQLSDGIHEISLEVCDISHCVEEIRTIELVNFAPVLVVDFEPALNPWSELIMSQTGTLVVNTTGTYDPEGDDFACAIDFNGEGAGWGNQWVCPEELTYTFDYTTEEPPASATLTVIAFDAVGNNAEYSVPVIFYNEIPDPLFTVVRTDNSSSSMVTLDGSATVDPGAMRSQSPTLRRSTGCFRSVRNWFGKATFPAAFTPSRWRSPTTVPSTPTKANPPPFCSRLTTPSPWWSLLHRRPKPSTTPN